VVAIFKRGGEEIGGGFASFVVMAQFLQEHGGENGIALFASFGLFHLDEHVFGVDVVGFDSSHFHRSKSGRIGGHKNESVFEVLRGVDDFPDVLLTEHRREFAILSADPIVKGDGVFNHVSVEKPQSCRHSATTAGRVAFAIF